MLAAGKISGVPALGLLALLVPALHVFAAENHAFDGCCEPGSRALLSSRLRSCSEGTKSGKVSQVVLYRSSPPRSRVLAGSNS